MANYPALDLAAICSSCQDSFWYIFPYLNNDVTFKNKYMLTLQSLKYQSNVFTDRIKHGSLFGVSLLYFLRCFLYGSTRRIKDIEEDSLSLCMLTLLCKTLSSLPWVCLWRLRSVVMLAQSQEHTCYSVQDNLFVLG